MKRLKHTERRKSDTEDNVRDIWELVRNFNMSVNRVYERKREIY